LKAKVVDESAIVIDDIDEEVVVKTQEQKEEELKSKVEVLYT
jgi:F0F1-type ATP synthase epsilon subunit